VRSPTTPSVLGRRDAINEAYDRGCDLVEAAVAIRHVAPAPGVAGAVPALLGCIECALDELANASAALCDMPSPATSGDSQHMTSRVRAADDRMRRGLANLETALTDARDIASAARALASRAIATPASAPRPS